MLEMSFEVEGAARLERKLKGLEKKVARKTVKQALRAGAKIVLKRTRAVTPVRTSLRTKRLKRNRGLNIRAIRAKGTMKRALTIRVAKKNRPGTYAVLQVFNTKKFPELIVHTVDGKRFFYPAAVEYGHAAPYRAGGAKVVSARSFIRRGFVQSKGQAKNEIIRKLKTGIERAWKSR